MPVATIDTFKRILLKPDNVTLEANVVGDSLSFVAGSGITLTANGNLDEITITNSASLGLVTLDNVLLAGNTSTRTATVGRLNVDNIVIDSNAIQFSDSTIQNTAWTGLPIASNSVLGGVKIDASSITINGSVISVPAVATIGQTNGIATLGSDGKLTSAQIPTSLSGAIIFKGTWNASTNTPTLVDGTGQNGWQYTVSVAGTVNLGSGSLSFVPGDFIIYNGSIWQKIAANTIAAAGTLTGSTLASGVTASSLTSVGTLINLTVTNIISGSINGNAGTVTNGVYTTDTGTVTNTMLSGSIANTKLTNSTISGKALGTNLDTLTLNTSGTGLSGSTTYDGSGAATFTVASNATSANTVSAIVARDANGDFSAGTITATITGSVSGNAGTVTNGVYTTGSYADPAWITSLAASKVGLGSVTNESKATMFSSPTFTGDISTAGIALTHATSNVITTNTASASLTISTFNTTIPGSITIRGGNSSTAAAAGAVVIISAGTGTTTGLGGYLSLSAGRGGATATGGNLTINSGIGGATSGNSGNINIDAGDVTSVGTDVIGTINIGAGKSPTINIGNTYTTNTYCTVTIKGVVKLPNVGTSGFVKLGAGGQLSADTNTYATGNGTASGTNTGDQTLPTLASLGAAPTASPTFTGTVSGVTATHVGLGNVTNESKATMFASPTFKDSILASTTVAGANFNLFSNLTGFQSLTIAGGNLTTGTDKYVYIGTGTNHATSTTTVEISSLTSGSLTKVWSPLTVVGNIGASNLSGTNTGDQTIPTTLPASDVYAWAKAATKPSYTATEVGLGNVTNESKATMFASPTFTGTVSGVTATHVGLGSVTNESKATMFASPTFTGTVSGLTTTTLTAGTVTSPAQTLTNQSGNSLSLVGSNGGPAGVITAGGVGGAVGITGGTGTGAGWGGSITIAGGIPATGGTGSGGSVLIKGGTSSASTTLSANSGLVEIRGGDTAASQQRGGNVLIYAGMGNGTTTYSSVFILTAFGGSSDTAHTPLTVAKFSAGSIYFPNLGTSGFVKLGASGLLVQDTTSYATGNGTASGTNTGDQTLPTLASLGAAPTASPTFTGTVSGVTATHVGLGNVTNESKATMFASPTFTGTVNVSGDIVATGNITAYSTSDIRLKENIQLIPNALGKLEQIRGVTFDWTAEEISRRGGEDSYFVRKHDVGVIAQEIEMVLPEIVGTRDNGMKAVQYEKLTALLIESVKELSAKVISLEQELNLLRIK